MDKIKDKIGGKAIIGTPIDKPKTFREQMIKQVYEEQRGHPVHSDTDQMRKDITSSDIYSLSSNSV